MSKDTQDYRDGWIGSRFYRSFPPADLYSLLRFRQRVSRVKTTNFTTVIRSKAKIQGK